MPPKSKSGEGIVIVIDVGPAVRSSTETTFYSQAKECLINILQRKIFADKCKDMVGVVLFGTDGTKNKLAATDQYRHVTVLQEPKFVDWDLISSVKQLPRGNTPGDWLDAVIVAMDLLHDPLEMFSTKKIVLMTDFNSEFTDDHADTIIQGIKEMDIEFSVIGCDMEDEEEDPDSTSNNHSTHTNNARHGKAHSTGPINWNGKLKTAQQLAAECLVKRIVAEVDGIICSFEEAIPQLIFFEKRSQASANWNAMLDIGPNFKIPVVGKIKIKKSMNPTWKKVYAEDENASCIPETSHHKKDEDKTVVDEEDIISGYRYGTTLIPFGEEDANLKYKCDVPGAVISVLGFTLAKFVPLTLRAGEQVVVITSKDGDEDGAVALSAIIQALKELDMVAITRRVYRKNLNPSLGALFPDITTDYECLVWIGLPFQEEIRSFSFPSLKKSMEKNTEEQKNLIDQLLDDMDLSAKEDQEEEMDPTIVVNPQIQHYYNCLTHRALKPTDPIPAPQQHIMDILSPPEKQLAAREALAEKLKKLFPTTKIEDYKQKKKDIFANANEDLNVASTIKGGAKLSSSDLTSVTVTKISTATPVHDFEAMLQGETANYHDICNQMQDVLLQMAESLSGDSATDQILGTKLVGAIKAFRKEAIFIDPLPFNDFIKQLKQIIKARGFGTLWTTLSKEENLCLIKQSETLKSKVTEEEAKEFLLLEEKMEESAVQVQDEGDYDDMLDDL